MYWLYSIRRSKSGNVFEEKASNSPQIGQNDGYPSWHERPWSCSASLRYAHVEVKRTKTVERCLKRKGTQG